LEGEAQAELWSSENTKIEVPTLWTEREGNTGGGGRISEQFPGPAESENCGMCGRPRLENREVSAEPEQKRLVGCMCRPVCYNLSLVEHIDFT